MTTRAIAKALSHCYAAIDELAFAAADERPALNARYAVSYTHYVSLLTPPPACETCYGCDECCDAEDLDCVHDVDIAEGVEREGLDPTKGYCEDCRADFQAQYGRPVEDIDAQFEAFLRRPRPVALTPRIVAALSGAW
jgi:hypothetical protein